MGDSTRSKMRGKFDEFSPIIGEKTFDFSIKIFFNKFLESNKDIKRVRFIFEWVKPCVLCMVINKYYVVFAVIKRCDL